MRWWTPVLLLLALPAGAQFPYAFSACECVGGAGTGDVVGPASAVDNEVPRYDSTTGKLLQGSGVLIDDSERLLWSANTGIVEHSSGVVRLIIGSSAPTQQAALYSSSIRILAQGDTSQSNPIIFLGTGGFLGLWDTAIRFTDGPNAENNLDAGLSRTAAGSVTFDGSSAGDRTGWFRWRGESYLAADGTNATATLATTGLSVTVTSGRKYDVYLQLDLSDSVAAEGALIDFDGGTATAANFRVTCRSMDTVFLSSLQLTALATDFAVPTITGDGTIECSGSFEPSSTGTFIPRYAQNTHSTGTLTLYRGSHLRMFEYP